MAPCMTTLDVFKGKQCFCTYTKQEHRHRETECNRTFQHFCCVVEMYLAKTLFFCFQQQYFEKMLSGAQVIRIVTA